MNVLRWFAPPLVSTLALACTTHIYEPGGSGAGSGMSGGAGAGGGTGVSCAETPPGLCPPTPCINGVQRTGQASCENGVWVCGEESCGGTGGCSSVQPECVGGQITMFCCNDLCSPPPPFCDLGNGMCFEGSCGDVDAGSSCTPDSISANEWDQSCSTDSDCASVYQGDLCSACQCHNATINVNSLNAYLGASNTPGKPVTVCDCPDSPPPVCIQGMCTVP
jgi:hypothetical protein